ncbi:uncharacterized protein LOC118484672 [Helianthus annuus]|uniref:uncharacterized protein LOC118484672 n=1 Tax=Helianthus annuus TaxID=4232 RepID=UPI001652D695|nr:uncharacterized protein LOC118484672 [Helianthus annuus]
MKTMYGGFGEVGASKVDCKNYRRDLNLYIGEYDAEMVVRRLIRKKECCPGFTCDYVIGEDRRLKGLFWADEQSKKIIQCLVTYLVLMLLINQTSMIWFLYHLLVLIIILGMSHLVVHYLVRRLQILIDGF